MNGLHIHVAAKDHRCDLCGRRIPKGARYWRDYQEDGFGDCTKDSKSHTNCEEFRAEDRISLSGKRGKDGLLVKSAGRGA